MKRLGWIALIVFISMTLFSFSCNAGEDEEDARSDDDADDDVDDDSDDDDAQDTEGPQILHEPIEDGANVEADVDIIADITDSSDVAEARVFYRAKGASSWQELKMTETKTSYAATIPASELKTTGMEYYIWAKDASDNENESTLPAGAPGEFFSFYPYCLTTGDVVETFGAMAYYYPFNVDYEFADQIQVVHSSYTVSAAKAYFYSSVTVPNLEFDVSVKIYSDDSDVPSDLIYETDVETVNECNNCSTDDWHTFELDEPVQFYENEKFWVAIVYKENSGGNRGLFSDAGTGIGVGMIYNPDTSSWGQPYGNRIFYIKPDGCFEDY